MRPLRSYRRRSVLILLALAHPALAQPRNRPPRIAVLEWEPAAGADRLLPFRKGLEDEGYTDGNSITIDVFFAEGRMDRAEELAQRIAGGSYDLAVAYATPAAHAMKRAARRMPIVFGSADPVGTGLVPNLSRPGGNITGVSSMLTDIEPKRLEIMCELLPGATRFVYLASSRDPASAAFVQSAQAAAERLGVSVSQVAVQAPDEIDAAVDTAVASGAQALIIQALFMLSSHSAGIVANVVRRRRIPAIGIYSPFVRQGGLVSFGPGLDFARRRTARYVARILAGASPGDMPIEQPTEFELAVNLTAARELGISIPALILARANEVVE